jgi:hypothetical protein
MYKTLVVLELSRSSVSTKRTYSTVFLILSTVCTYRRSINSMLFILTYGRYNTVWCKTSTVVYLPILLYGIFYKASIWIALYYQYHVGRSHLCPLEDSSLPNILS